MFLKTAITVSIFTAFAAISLPAQADKGVKCDSNGRAYIICTSSVLKSGKLYSYGAENFSTPGAAWCEGASDRGVGQTIRLAFPSRKTLTAIEIENGYNRTPQVWKNNGRVKKVSITSNLGFVGTRTLRDTPDAQTFSVPPQKYKWLLMTIVSVYPGAKGKDTCLGVVWPDLR